MYGKFKEDILNRLDQIDKAGTTKNERIITSPQDAEIMVKGRGEMYNFCANNYLGLSSNRRVIKAAKIAMYNKGFGLSSVRFICGTQDIHQALEVAISDYFKTEDTILYGSCFDANGGLFEPLFDENDAIISDSLNHASIIDGIRLSKAQRFRYDNCNMESLEKALIESRNLRHRIIATDAVFSMDGNVAPLDKICALADKYNAMIMVDECHSAGVVGPTGRGIGELFGLNNRIDLRTGTLGKAFGGSMGGFTTGRKEIIDLLRQCSRPYLFSNSLPPAVVGGSMEVFAILGESNVLHKQLLRNIEHFTQRIKSAGFEIKPTQSAICAIMLHDADLAQEFAAKMLDHGIYVIGFSYPVVPLNEARIRVQISAAHNIAHIDKCVQAFITVGKELKVI